MKRACTPMESRAPEPLESLASCCGRDFCHFAIFLGSLRLHQMGIYSGKNARIFWVWRELGHWNGPFWKSSKVAHASLAPRAVPAAPIFRGRNWQPGGLFLEETWGQQPHESVRGGFSLLKILFNVSMFHFPRSRVAAAFQRCYK